MTMNDEMMSIRISDILDGTVSEVAEQQNSAEVPRGSCVECEDQQADVFCEQCLDDFCTVCFTHQHRKGTRQKHSIKKLRADPVSTGTKQNVSTPAQNTITAEEFIAGGLSVSLSDQAMSAQIIERSKYIPLRLKYEERKFLRLLEAGLNVSEYTDKVDVVIYGSKSKRIVAQIKELCSILSGLVLAADYKVGQQLFQDRDFEGNREFFQTIFELGRRHKIMNPEKMRSTYGKLVYLLQDSQIPEVKELLQFDCVKPITMVYNVLEEAGALAILSDELIHIATMEIIDDGKKRYQVQKEIQNKERAIEHLAKKYSKGGVSSDLIRQCLYSIGDNNAFLRTNRDPCLQMITYLKHFFAPNAFENGHSLAISFGREGSRLSHNHSKQYQYVLQSLSLWSEVLNEMFMLWTLAEQDLLSSSNFYRLSDTGQGLNRVQAAPQISRMMHTILHRAQQKVGSWVGSSVIHLGDHNVPNALMFIDKYTQIYRILLPIVTTIQKIDTLVSAKLSNYIDSAFGSKEQAKKVILGDFFRHGFDGSGADNSFDAGSCIDGRLTSAWNWCSNLEKKEYFPLFLLTGFMGFDGQFN